MADSQTKRIDVEEQSIRELAQKKWQEAGCPTGDGTEFWFAAEKELMESNPEIPPPTKPTPGTPQPGDPPGHPPGPTDPPPEKPRPNQPKPSS